jgi:hypothetical protein
MHLKAQELKGFGYLPDVKLISGSFPALKRQNKKNPLSVIQFS